MKKSVLVVIISLLVLATTVVWLLNAKTITSLQVIVQYGVILVLVGFALYVGFSRLKSEKRSEPPEDELSKKFLQKASSTAYYISLYMWLAFIYFSDKTKLETHTLIAGGILGMAIIFCACWIIYKIRGIKDA